jgi:hypothetical protein
MLSLDFVRNLVTHVLTSRGRWRRISATIKTIWVPNDRDGSGRTVVWSPWGSAA